MLLNCLASDVMDKYEDTDFMITEEMDSATTTIQDFPKSLNDHSGITPSALTTTFICHNYNSVPKSRAEGECKELLQL